MSDRNILPFFKISISYTIFYLLVIVILPISHLFYSSLDLDLDKFFSIIFSPRVIHSFKLTIVMAITAGFINVFLGFIISWTLARYNFRAKAILDIFIDLPIALPTAVAGLSLAHLYSDNTFIGKSLNILGIEVAYSKLGIIVALIFVGLPLSIRTIEPIIRELDEDVEIAAYNLGANTWNVLKRIYLPSFLPALLSAFNISFARGLSEYGAIIFISSNIPNHSEIVSLLIYSKVEQFDYNEAAAIAVSMLILAFIMLSGINFITNRVIK